MAVIASNRAESGNPLMEQSVWQARWLLVLVFALSGGFMLVGVLFG